MDITIAGNPKAMMEQTVAAAPLPAAEGAPVGETPSQVAPNLVVTSNPESEGTGGIPPSVIEKAIVRDDALGRLVDKAFGDMATRVIPAKIGEELSKSEHATAKATIDSQNPSEREIEMRKESLKREAQKADERRNEELAAAQLRAQLEGGLLPGERVRPVEDLCRITIRA